MLNTPKKPRREVPQQACKKCQSTNYVKSGHTRGHQRYSVKNVAASSQQQKLGELTLL